MDTNLQAADELAKTFVTVIHEKVASMGAFQKKVLKYPGMIGLLTVIYYCYHVRDAMACEPNVALTLSQLGALMLKFLLFTAWPFALMSFFDSSWRSNDAGNVFLISYVITGIIWYHKTGCGFCIFAASAHLIPYVFCAWTAHGLGSLRHHWRRTA
ncbi:MAG: hypothetical protein ACREFR_08395 [Limisphaerales bacterium]